MLTPNTAEVLAMLNGPEPRRRTYRDSMTAATPTGQPMDAPKDREEPTISTLAELLVKEFPPIVWTVPGILQRGACYMLAGAPKGGKSWLSLSLALSIATAGRALGSLEVTTGNVLYLDLENGPRRLKGRVQKLLAHDPDADISRFDWSCKWRPTSDGSVDYIREWAKLQRNPSLVIIDTLIRVRDEDRKDKSVYRQDYESLSVYTDLAHELNCTILIVHHTNKGDSQEDVLREVSGSTGMTGATDGTLVLKRKRGQREGTLWVISRDEEDQQLSIQLDDLTNGWVLLGNAEDIAATKAQRDILELLEEESDGKAMNPKEIAGALDANANTIAQQLRRMKQSGLVRRVGYGLYEVTSNGIDRVRADSRMTRHTRHTRHSSGESDNYDGYDTSLSESDPPELLGIVVRAILRRGGALYLTDGELAIDMGAGPEDELLAVPGGRPKRLRAAIYELRPRLTAYVEGQGGLVDTDGPLFDTPS